MPHTATSQNQPGLGPVGVFLLALGLVLLGCSGGGGDETETQTEAASEAEAATDEPVAAPETSDTEPRATKIPTTTTTVDEGDVSILEIDEDPVGSGATTTSGAGGITVSATGSESTAADVTTSSTAPTTSPTTTDPTTTTRPTQNEPDEHQGPILIATLGDSNTESGFWRAAFQDVFRAENCAIDMIGGRSVAWSAALNRYDLDTDAVGGARMADKDNPSNTVFQLGRSTIDGGRADLVIVVGGTNDVLSERSRSAPDRNRLNTALNTAEGHLRDAMERSPGSIFLVADTVRLPNDQGLVDFYNNGLARIAGNVGAVHMNIETSTADLSGDGVHFDEAGGRRYGTAIARQVLDLSRNRGLC